MSAAASPPETTLLLVRHAQSKGAERFCGSTDVPLSPDGHTQLPSIIALLDRWPISRIYTSPLCRALATADAIAGSRGLTAMPRPNAREIDFGDWEGLSWSEIEATSSAFARQWMENFPAVPAPGGEPFVAFRHRVKIELDELAELHPTECVVLVSHSGFIRTALAIALDFPDRNIAKLRHDYGAVTELIRCQETWIVARFNVPPPSRSQR